MRVTKQITSTRDKSVGARLALAAALSAVLLAACASNSEPSGQVAQRAGGRNAVEVVADDGAFTPKRLELKAGQEVTVDIVNEDDVPHDFAIEELDLNTGTIEPGDVASATFTLPEHPIDFACTFHSEMTGRIEAR